MEEGREKEGGFCPMEEGGDGRKGWEGMEK